MITGEHITPSIASRVHSDNVMRDVFIAICGQNATNATNPVRDCRSVEKRYSPTTHLRSVRNATIAEGRIPNGMCAKERAICFYRTIMPTAFEFRTNQRMVYTSTYSAGLVEYTKPVATDHLVAIAMKTRTSSSLYYTHTDHLGSLRVVTNENKGIVSRYHYDAWGKRTLVAGSHITHRGFTGHEHLEPFGLINTNARMYDPVLARFLSPDMYVQAPTFTQSYNRYSYVWNNPLMYIDPTGYLTTGHNTIYTGTVNKISGVTVYGQAINQSTDWGAYWSVYNTAFSDWARGLWNEWDNRTQTSTLIRGWKHENLGGRGGGGDGTKWNRVETYKNQAERNLTDHERTMNNPLVQSIHRGQTEFWNYPVTKITLGTVLFIGTGGIEGVIGLATGTMSMFQLVTNSQMSDWVRTGMTVVPNQSIYGVGVPGASRIWAIKGGGNLYKTGQPMGFHYHIHQYNWYTPWTWFKQTPIIKP